MRSAAAIVDEEILNTQQLSLARAALRQAEVICLLGFGYHPFNLNRLQIENFAGEIYGTSSGMVEGLRKAVVKRFADAGNTIHLADEYQDILAFLN